MAKSKDEIWDDESGTPPPMTAAEQDRRLEVANERQAQENEESEARLAELEGLIRRKEQLAARMQVFLQEARQERDAINEREKLLGSEMRRLRTGRVQPKTASW